MAILRVRCTKCKQWIPTGVEMSREAFKNATYTTLTAECPNCEHLQTWTLDDVDRSVFEEKKP